ncbi:hypothetical protein ISN76_19595 [Dyella halodurans]|nr:hypothetical protein [Dyella halodurans]
MSDGKTVRYTLDPDKPVSLSAEAKARLAAKRDSGIDTSDLPDLAGEDGWYCPGSRDAGKRPAR